MFAKMKICLVALRNQPFDEYYLNGIKTSKSCNPSWALSWSRYLDHITIVNSINEIIIETRVNYSMFFDFFVLERLKFDRNHILLGFTNGKYSLIDFIIPRKYSLVDYIISADPNGSIKDIGGGVIEEKYGGIWDGSIQDTKDGNIQDIKDGSIQDTKDGSIHDSKHGSKDGSIQDSIQDIRDGSIQDTKDGSIHDSIQDINGEMIKNHLKIIKVNNNTLNMVKILKKNSTLEMRLNLRHLTNHIKELTNQIPCAQPKESNKILIQTELINSIVDKKRKSRNKLKMELKELKNTLKIEKLQLEQSKEKLLKLNQEKSEQIIQLQATYRDILDIQCELILGLRHLYPITKNDFRYLIRNLSEDDVGVYYGMVAHMLILLSYYMHLPLKYPIKYHCSLSEIGDFISENSYFPLYKQKGFDYAMFLIAKDTEQVMIH
jgi:hypothetical protein